MWKDNSSELLAIVALSVALGGLLATLFGPWAIVPPFVGGILSFIGLMRR